MLYDIRLRITYSVGQSAASGRMIMRIAPMAVDGVQQVSDVRLTLDPGPEEMRQGVDFFGNPIVETNHHAAWSKIVITMQARIERRAPAVLSADASAPLARLTDEISAVHSLDPDSPHHFTGPSTRAASVPAIAAFARKATEGCATALDATLALNRALHRHLKFDADATTVNTPAAEAFAKRRGVCQDFTHIMIVALRALGIPAGYASGYLRTIQPAGKPRLEGADAMHAWVRAWCGRDIGWVEVDPTNDLVVGVDHIIAGRGRDYSDVSPIRGVLRTAGAQKTKQEVDVIPLA